MAQLGSTKSPLGEIMTVGLSLGPESLDSDPEDSSTMWYKTSNFKILYALVSPSVKQGPKLYLSHRTVVTTAGNNA